MRNVRNFDNIFSKSVYDSIIMEYYFPDVIFVIFRNYSAR